MAFGRKTGGRQRGTPNKYTLSARQRIERIADPIKFLTGVLHGEPIERAESSKSGAEGQTILVRPTLDQSLNAAKILADKLVPPAKGRRVKLSVPQIKEPRDLIVAHDSVIKAIAEGVLSPDEGLVFSNVLTNKGKAIETVDLAERVKKLEDRANGPR